MASPLDLAHYLRISNALIDDEQNAEVERRSRDRQFGLNHSAAQLTPLQRIVAWYQAQGNADDEARINHDHAIGRLLGFIIITLGIGSGWLLSNAVLSFDGDHPVNIVHALAVLLLPQLLTLIIWLLITINAPAMPNVAKNLATLPSNPGYAIAGLAKYINQAVRDYINARRQLADGTLLRWQMACWSHGFVICFNLGAIAALLYQVTINDLAFVWNTTWAVSAGQVSEWFNAIAWPWRDWLSSAVPSEHLITESRYYRLENSQSRSTQAVAALGQWWPFLLCCLLFYGFLPRLLCWLLSTYQLRRNLRSGLLKRPEVAQLLARMDAPWVQTQAAESEHAMPLQDSTQEIMPFSGSYAGNVLVWSDCPTTALTNSAYSINADNVIAVGGSRSLSEDNQAINQSQLSASNSIAIIIKGYEAPTLELMDFIEDLQRHHQDRLQTLLLWLAMPAPHQVDEQFQLTWQQALHKFNTPPFQIGYLAA